MLNGVTQMRNLTKNTTTANRERFAMSAEDVMTRHPLSIDERATLREAAAFLTEKGISAAPVINEAGRPVGVLSLADIVRSACVDESATGGPGTPVRDVMTPVVFFVRPETCVGSVIDDLLTCAVHRLFVVDDHEVLVGVISTLDLLRFLHVETTAKSSSMSRRGKRRRTPAGVVKSVQLVLETSGSGSDIVMAGAAS
jgi:CBS domain-containing protein